MPIDLYREDGSPPCMAVRLLANAIGVQFNEKTLDLMAGDHLKADFLKINPQHIVPTIVDNGFSLWESRAIMIYLINEYAPDSPLYPKDPKKRALVNQRLMFDQGTLYPGIIGWWMDMFQKKPITDEHFKKIDTGIEFFNKFLENSKYAAGDTVTLADYALFVTVASADATGHAIKDEFGNVKRWLEDVRKTIPGSEIVDSELKALNDWLAPFKN